MTTPDDPRPAGRVSVVLPVYRNRRQLPELYRRLTEVLTRLTAHHELVFVDDAGCDGSLEWLRECRRLDDRVTVVEMAENGGQHPAVVAGLARSTGDIVAVMDADLQDPPEALPDLVRVLGSRDAVVFAKRTTRHQTRVRHWTGLLFKRFLRLLAGSRVPTGTGMFFVASRSVVEAVGSLSANVRYVPLLLDQTGVSLTAVPVGKDWQPDVPSAYSAARRLRLALGAVRQAIEWRRARKRIRLPVRDPLG